MSPARHTTDDPAAIWQVDPPCAVASRMSDSLLSSVCLLISSSSTDRERVSSASKILAYRKCASRAGTDADKGPISVRGKRRPTRSTDGIKTPMIPLGPATPGDRQKRQIGTDM